MHTLRFDSFRPCKHTARRMVEGVHDSMTIYILPYKNTLESKGMPEICLKFA